MSGPDFEAVLDACLSDVASGRRSVEECLAAWPRFRERLEPLLSTAATMRDLRLADTTPDPARRAQLMTAITSTPQQRRRRLPRFSFAGMLRPLAVAAPAAAVAAVAVALLLARGDGGPTAEAATLTTFTGTVERSDGEQWTPLRDNGAVDEGDHLRTDAGGSAVLTFADGTTITLDPSTEVIVERSRLGGGGIQLRQLSGRVWNNVAPADGDSGSFVVRTIDATMTARGTVFETSIAEGETAISAEEGNVEVQSGDQRVTLSAGQVLRARLGARLGLPIPRGDTGRQIQFTVDGPFVASLISPRGLATGARPDGLVYQQIPATLTTSPAAGPQQITVLVPVNGEYTLIVRRVEEGGGAIVIEAGGEQQRIPVGDAVRAMSIKLRVEVTGGHASAVVENATPVDPRRIDQAERLIVTERIRARAADVLRQILQERRERRQGGP